nr:Rpn family recombination-promoting nuclease/putative transposase [Flammeovirga aprica]
MELQRASQTFFKDRTIYYSNFPIQEQAEKGMSLNYELHGVYVISIMDFVFDDTGEHYYHTVELKNQNNQVFYDKLKFVYLELPKFYKKDSDLESNFDKWLYLLKNFEEMPSVLQERIFRRVFKMTEYMALPKNDQMKYDQDVKRFRDYANTLKTKKEEGIEIGEKRGERKAIIKTAKKLLSMGFKVQKVVEATGLTILEVETLISNSRRD